MSVPYRVGIVGFGVAGGTAAFLAAKAGHSVSLFERADRLGLVGAGVLLQPSGQIVLKRLGLLDRVVARAEPIEELHALTHRGASLIRLPFGEIAPECRAFGLHRGDFFDVILDEVTRAGVNVETGVEIRSKRREGDKVFLEDANGRRHGPFDFVVAADGSRSTLRASSGLIRRKHEYAYGAIWAIGRDQEVRGELHQVVRGTRDLAGLLPMGGGRCSLFWSLRHDRKAAVWNAGFRAWRDDVLSLCPRARPLFDELTDFEQVSYVRYQHVEMRSWHDDDAIFLGDAGHAMSPHLGQGINLALIDAETFVNRLQAAEHYLEAFRAYDRARRSHLRYYSAITLGLTPFFQSDGVVKGIGRDIALPIMTRLPIVRDQMLISMAGIKGGFFSGKVDFA